MRQLYLKDERFREACEDYAASIASLRRFEARDDAELRPEVQDYRRLLRELEDELHKYLSSCGSG
ncbi:hypothetical protein H0I76_13050 [Limibaculum sp. M0105]|uniref:Uncharacterized protein n=1 Tax=Thermohalobaculum xanthum TaxID=2753746 RepID=A0A8J7M8E9_9RHOB|nr:hypothetical protein [Thermohalobaculum xanthum]MBK0400120.1 hypothetical protein [Thermohalobaculum xanthum]